MILRAGHFEYRFPRPALVVGIVNVTPDSFAEWHGHADPAQAVAHGLRLVQQGADLLDIGGESTRPGATPVSEAEELRRVLPVIEELARQVPIPLSIDTMKPKVARAALAAGAVIINDVAANRADADMGRLVAESGAGYVCMHMQGTPQTMQVNPVYTDVVREVTDFFQARLQRLEALGVRAEQVVLDVGIGFGKLLEHNLQLLGALRGFTKLRRPLMLGASRKSFLGKLQGAGVGERLPGSLACACLAVAEGVQLVRVHDVAETVQAVRTTEAILARRQT